MQRDSLKPKLDAAERALKAAMDEACNVDVHRANTGEMIRVEETLAIASNAAKEVVSVRLRRRTLETNLRQLERELTASPPIDRVFDDTRGKRWHVYAIHPSGASMQSVPLRDAYKHGWLCFESHDQLKRLAPIPENWQEMTDDELRLLCLRAVPSSKRH